VTEGDHIAFAIDPMNNGSAANFIEINASNAYIDGILLPGGNWDSSRDGAFQTATHIYDDHWTVEVRLPLNALTFQDAKRQDWGFLVGRFYSPNQELIISNLQDVDQPFRISNFFLLTGLDNLRQRQRFSITPNLYSATQYDQLNRDTWTQTDLGGDFRYAPTSASVVLITVNPDFAQIESDQEVINVTDVPTDYQEKRPFFIEASDMYPMTAVNTRNVGDIRAGLKYRQVGRLWKSDVTGVLDTDETYWYFTNLRIADEKTFRAEVIGGYKDAGESSDFSVMNHFMKWYFDRKFFFHYSYSLINSPEGGPNEWERWSALDWTSRTIHARYSDKYKTELFNPGMIGRNVLSNGHIQDMWIGYTHIRESGFFRQAGLKINHIVSDLASHPGHRSYTDMVTQANEWYLGEALGQWAVTLISYRPTNMLFRYRNTGSDSLALPYRDAFGDFTLVSQNGTGVKVEIKSDYAKSLGVSYKFDNTPVRRSRAQNHDWVGYFRLSERTILKYSLAYIDIAGSAYQSRFSQTIHRAHLEYNFTERMNLRIIYQPQQTRYPEADQIRNELSMLNLTFSWEYLPGSYFYLVYNRLNELQDYRETGGIDSQDSQIFMLKINRTFRR
jgi:hypothetical protein